MIQEVSAAVIGIVRGMGDILMKKKGDLRPSSLYLEKRLALFVHRNSSLQLFSVRRS